MQTSRKYHRIGNISSHYKLDEPNSETHELNLIKQYILILVQRVSEFTERDTGLLLSARKYHKQIHSDTKTQYVQTVRQEQHN